MSLRYEKFASEKNQVKPKIHPVSITADEAYSTEFEKQQLGFLKCSVCCGIFAAVILIIAVVMLVLGFTVLHVKDPKIRMNSVAIVGLDGVNSTELRNGNVNLTVVADVSVKNTNVEGFKFEGFNSSLLYHGGTVVAVVEVPGGVIKARRTMRLNLEYEMMMKKMAGDPQFRRDLTAGNLTVLSYTRITGRVKILNIIKRQVTVTMNCSIAINVTSRGIAEDCKSHFFI
ncbi:hypothetical protein LXL04_005510 [Taraxacum kok-saghyz]